MAYYRNEHNDSNHQPFQGLEEGDFKFFLEKNNEYFEGRQNFDKRGVIVYFICRVPYEATFNKWCMLN